MRNTAPKTTEGAVAAAPSTVSESPSLNRPQQSIIPRRRNAHRVGSAQRLQEFAALGRADTRRPAGGPEGDPEGPARAECGGLLLAPGATPRDAWVAWLAPRFAGNASCYFTGTYSDDYGVPNGLMLQRNVHKDFARFLESFEYQGDYVVAVEQHAFRDVLHLHAILAGPFTEDQMLWVKRWWSAERGHARALPVLDGCSSYVTKYALKNDTDAFEWRFAS